jgi:hypothetical protein
VAYFNAVSRNSLASTEKIRSTVCEHLVKTYTSGSNATYSLVIALLLNYTLRPFQVLTIWLKLLQFVSNINKYIFCIWGTWKRSGKDTMLQAGRSRVRDPMRYIFSAYLILPTALGSGIYSASDMNEYQKLTQLIF